MQKTFQEEVDTRVLLFVKKCNLVNATIDVDRSVTGECRGSKTVIMNRAVSGFAVADERAEDYGQR